MKSIRRQLTRRLVLALALLLGAGLVAIYVVARRSVLGSFDAALQARALAVAALSEVEHGAPAFDFSPDFLRGYGAEKPRHYFEIWSPAGQVLTRSPSLGAADLEAPANLMDRPRTWNLTLPNGRPGRAVAFTFKPDLPAADRARLALMRWRLVVASDREDLNEILTSLLAGIVACGGLLLAAVTLVVPRVLRRGLAPLERLGAQAGRIDAQSLASRFAVADLPAELRPIAAGLNDLLARLERSFERERRFSADLAHEFRTPLAELRTLAECALKWPESRDPATDHEALAIARQMEAMVGRMLALARGEESQLAARREAVALDRIVSECWRRWAPRAAERGLVARPQLAAATAMADPALLRSILGNLFDNAVDYAAAGGEIEVTVEPAPAGARVRVANRADQLEAADLPKLFDRFWRKEAARSGGQHVGLGLALARAMAEAMGWQLTAALTTGQIVFTLEPKPAAELKAES